MVSWRYRASTEDLLFDCDRAPTGLADGLATAGGALRALSKAGTTTAAGALGRASRFAPARLTIAWQLGPPFALVPDEDDSAGQSVSRAA